jgi:hypothetical protein
MESTVVTIKRELDLAPQKKVAPRRIAESVAFAKFLNAIRVSSGGRKNR